MEGELQLLGGSGDDPVELLPPDPLWPERFEATRERLADALGPTALRIDHVGSTAIRGISAKPVIDVQVSVPDIDDEQAYRPAIESLGWPLRAREPGLGHRFFRDPAGAPRRVHVHVCQAGGEWERSHLLFRDYLRRQPDRAQAYDRLKQAAAERYRGERLAYTESKGPFIEETLVLAEEWARKVGWRP